MKYETAIILAHGLNKDKSLDRETRERTNLGINIFRENKTGTLLMSGGHKDLGECYGVSLSEAMKRYAIRQGTLGNLILEEDISLETVGELIFCKIGIIDPRNWKKILIVSHGYHIPRVRTITNIVFGDEYQIEFESIKSDLNFDKEILEKERESEELFKRTFKDIKGGDNSALLERLLEKHVMYNKSPELFGQRLEKLKIKNSP